MSTPPSRNGDEHDDREPGLSLTLPQDEGRAGLSRIAQLDQRTALPDQCLHSAEADVRPPRRKSGLDPKATSPRLKALRTRPNRRMKMANAPALIGHRDQHGEARWRLDDASILGL